MPIYNIENTKTKEIKEVMCSYDDLQVMLKDKEWERVLGFPKIISGTGSLQSKVPGGFKDRLKQIKKNGGGRITIKI